MFKDSSKDNILNKIPLEGFIKIPKSGSINLKSSDRVALVRRGNEFLNRKHYEQAKKVFLTIGYSAGLIRLGECYQEDGKIYEALKMYKSAKAEKKMNNLAEKMASALQVWIND